MNRVTPPPPPCRGCEQPEFRVVFQCVAQSIHLGAIRSTLTIQVRCADPLLSVSRAQDRLRLIVGPGVGIESVQVEVLS